MGNEPKDSVSQHRRCQNRESQRRYRTPLPADNTGNVADSRAGQRQKQRNAEKSQGECEEAGDSVKVTGSETIGTHTAEVLGSEGSWFSSRGDQPSMAAAELSQTEQTADEPFLDAFNMQDWQDPADVLDFHTVPGAVSGAHDCAFAHNGGTGSKAPLNRTSVPEDSRCIAKRRHEGLGNPGDHALSSIDPLLEQSDPGMARLEQCHSGNDFEGARPRRRFRALSTAATGGQATQHLSSTQIPQSQAFKVGSRSIRPCPTCTCNGHHDSVGSPQGSDQNPFAAKVTQLLDELMDLFRAGVVMTTLAPDVEMCEAVHWMKDRFDEFVLDVGEFEKISSCRSPPPGEPFSERRR